MEDTISDFLVNTCRIKSQPNFCKLVLWRDRQKDASLVNIGSTADIYVETVVESDRDVDILAIERGRLAVPNVHRIPQRLPQMFSNNVEVYEMVDTEFPGYVQLSVIGHMKRQSAGNEFTFTPSPVFSQTTIYWNSEHSPPTRDLCGRGVVFSSSNTCGLDISCVRSIRCLAWPTQASQWPLRSRKNEWPNSATIKCVVDSGCDLVKGAHRHWRKDEFLRGQRWRISFARAETLLLNTWTPRQQLVYQILLVIMKKSGLCTMRDHNGDEMLTKYHVKTVMMWNSELKPLEWWTKSNVIRLSTNMIHVLLSCCISSRCDGYFITSSNLFECAVSESVKSRLQSFTDVTFLTQWLIRNCFRGADDCPHHIESLFKDVSTREKLQLALNAFHHWKQQKALHESFARLEAASLMVCVEFSKRSSTLDESVIRKWRTEFSEIDQRLVHSYVTPIFCLSLLSRIDVTSNVVDIVVLDTLTAVLSNHDGLPAMSTATTSCISLMQKAVYLLRLCRNTNNTLSSSLLLLSFTYLQNVNKNMKQYGDSIPSLAAVYLSVLYHITGQYKKAISKCSCLVRLYAAQSQNISCIVESECMPKINDNIDSVFGLTVLYQYVYQKSFSQSSHAAHVNVLSAHLFAHYLMLESRRYLDKGNGSVKRAMIKQYKSDFCKTLHPFITDLLLLYVSCEKRSAQDEQVSHATESISLRFKASELNRLLLAISVEYLTSFRQILSHDFISLCEIATTELEAMYYYKCEMYERSFLLSKRNFDLLWSQSTQLDVPLMGCMTHITDDKLAALLGVYWIVSADRTGSILQLTLSVYLLASIELWRSGAQTVFDLLTVIKILHRRCLGSNTLNNAVLSYVYRKTVVGLSKIAMS